MSNVCYLVFIILTKLFFFTSSRLAVVRSVIVIVPSALKKMLEFWIKTCDTNIKLFFILLF